MKAFVIPLIAVGVLGVGSTPILIQDEFKPKTITITPEIKMTGLRGAPAGGFVPQTITMNKFVVMGVGDK